MLDTALVIEGNLKTLGLHVVDMLFRQALSEWTTVTIPYSRIVRCSHARNLFKTIAFFSLILLPFVIALVSAALAVDNVGAAEIGILLVAGAVVAIPLGFLMVLLYYLFDIGPRTTLTFRRPDNRVLQVNFRIRPRALQRTFLQRLEANRKVVEALPVQARSK